MKIKLSYAKREDLPAGFEELYDEQDDGTFALTGVEGMKTDKDIAKLSKSLKDEREAHKDTKQKLKVLDGIDDPETLADRLGKLEELEAENATLKAGGKGKAGTEEVERLVEARIKRVVAPIERERDQYKAKVGELEAETGTLKGTLKRGKMETQARRLASDLKVIPQAIDDVLLNVSSLFDEDEDGNVTHKELGVGMDVWLKDMQEKRPHWWATSVGGGAGGGSGLARGQKNPWSAQGWNLTEQGKYVREHGIEKANQLAGMAGSKVGATSAPKAA
jgi:hypothetical protein